LFQATPLDQVAREIEGRFGVSVEIADAFLEEIQVTVTFTERPLDEVIVVLCEVVGAACSVEGGVVRIARVPDALPVR